MKYWFRDLPIKWKLTVVSLVVTSSVLLAASIAFFVYDQVSFRKQLLNQVASLAGVVGANSTAALTFRDARVAERILSTLGTERHVMFSVLYDSKDTVLATYRRPDIEQDLYPSLVVPNGYHYHAGRLCVFAPVVLEGERIGIVCLIYSMDPVYARLGRYAAVVLTVLGASILAAWALVSYLQSYVSRPITRLMETADQITAGGDMNLRAEGEGGDEIGALVMGFNTMLDQIEVRDVELREHQKKLRSLAAQLVLTEERERRRIASGIHDSICQMLVVANMKLSMLSEYGDRNAVIQSITEAEDLINGALSEARSLTFQLSPPVLYEFGLDEALHRLTEQVASQYELNVVFEGGQSEREVSEDISVILYRAVRELLINAYKHASAECVVVNVTGSDNRVRIMVKDDGIGFEPKTSIPRGSSGFGLFSIRERLSHIGGKMVVRAAPGAGTTVILDVPLAADDAVLNS